MEHRVIVFFHGKITTELHPGEASKEYIFRIAIDETSN
jgi:hypothetical protein